MTNPYTTTSNQLETLLNRYLQARAALQIFETLRKLKSPNHAGKKKVARNVAVFTDYKYFFNPAEEMARFYTLIELSKFFDRDVRALSVPKVLKAVRKDLARYNPENYFAYRESRGDATADHLKSFYRPPTRRDLANINKSIRPIKSVVKKLTRYRNQALAHDAMNKDPIDIKAFEVHRVFRALEKVIDKLAARVLWSTTLRDAYLRDSKNDTKRVLYDLLELRNLRNKN